jgi:hypothetical protein
MNPIAFTSLCLVASLLAVGPHASAQVSLVVAHLVQGCVDFKFSPHCVRLDETHAHPALLRLCCFMKLGQESPVDANFVEFGSLLSGEALFVDAFCHRTLLLAAITRTANCVTLIFWFYSYLAPPAPLVAAVMTQRLSSLNAISYLRRTCFDGSNKSIDLGFTFVTTDSAGNRVERTLHVPLSTLMPIPFLEVRRVLRNRVVVLASTIPVLYLSLSRVIRGWCLLQIGEMSTKITNTGSANPARASALPATIPSRYKLPSEIQGYIVPQQAINGPESREFSMKLSVTAGNDEVPGGIARLLSSLQDTITTK